MIPRVIALDQLADHAELRSFLREGPPAHLAFEVLQEADGRAWTLRVPLDRRSALVSLVRTARRAFARGDPFSFDAQGFCMLGRETIIKGDDIAALILEQEGQKVFALWRLELLRDGWSWTLDVLFVPLALAETLLERIDEALGKVGRQ
jgi:hypothetical protein